MSIESAAAQPRQQRAWIALADEPAGPVHTIDQLLRRVRSCKARMAADERNDAVRASRLASMDALFEWCADARMPDAPPDKPGACRGAGASAGWTVRREPSRAELEQELIALVATGKGDCERAAKVQRMLRRFGA